MTAAERYRQLEVSPSVQVARWIFNNRLNNSPKIPLREVVEDIKTGKTPSKNEKKYYENGVLDWFKPSEIGEGKYLTSAKDKLSKLAMDTKQATIYRPGTLLITAIGDIGRLAITKDIASSNQQITGIAFNKLVLPEYAYYYFLAFRAFFYTDVSQTTLPIVNQKKITSIPFILCSVEEQKATTDFLSAIELITLPKDVEQLDRLTSDSELLVVAKGIFAIHFASATLVTEFDKQKLHLTQLRQALLREAMQGQLLPQDPTDEPAAVLLQKLQAAKATADKAGKRKAGPLFVEQAEAVEGPFEIPENWVWCQTKQISQLITSGSRDWAKYYSASGAKFIRMGNLSRGTFALRLNKMQYVKAPKSGEGNRTKLEAGDILVSVTGEVGNLGLIPPDFGEAYINQHTALVRLNPEMDALYVAYCFLSPELQAQFNAPQRGMKNSFRLSDVDELFIPLPPLAEQHRIVAKLEQLLQHCDALEQRIRESRRLAEQLLQTALREALAPPAGVEEYAEEVPELATADKPASMPVRRGRPRRPSLSLKNPLPDLFSDLLTSNK